MTRLLYALARFRRPAGRTMTGARILGLIVIGPATALAIGIAGQAHHPDAYDNTYVGGIRVVPSVHP